MLCGIISRFQLLSPRYGQIAHALLTRPPCIATFDLHVLSTPPAFILSQNQTLKFNCIKPNAFASVALSRLFSHLSLLTLLFGTICTSKLIDRNYFLNSFPSIQFLNFINRKIIRCLHNKLVYNNTQKYICQTNFITFLINFHLFFLCLFVKIQRKTLLRFPLIHKRYWEYHKGEKVSTKYLYIFENFLSKSIFDIFRKIYTSGESMPGWIFWCKWKLCL